MDVVLRQEQTRKLYSKHNRMHSLKILFQYSSEETEETHQKSVMTASVPAEIQTVHLQDMSIEHYNCATCSVLFHRDVSFDDI
jgi:hypothetical protein